MTTKHEKTNLPATNDFDIFGSELVQNQEFDRNEYLSSFEMIRAHLHLCLKQVETIGDINYPEVYQKNPEFVLHADLSSASGWRRLW